MVASNWEDRDAKTNPIIDYFADRQNTELILRKVKKGNRNELFFLQNVQKLSKVRKQKKNLQENGILFV